MQDETRRAELDSFHTVLTDISHGATTNDVREFMIDAYVRGYEIATAAHVPFEGSTAVFTRRRYRDKWNRTVVRRIAKKHNHSIKIRACPRSGMRRIVSRSCVRNAGHRACGTSIWQEH